MDCDDKETTILVLGDGDFSWSYDMARHLASLTNTAAETKDGNDKHKKNPRFHLIATELQGQSCDGLASWEQHHCLGAAS